MRTDELKRKILHIFNDGEHYGYDISKKLNEESKEVDLSRLYTVLNEMNNEGLLKGRWEKSERGPKKKIYSLSKKGIRESEKLLLEAIETVHIHYENYLMKLPIEYSVFNKIVAKVIEETNPKSNIGFITPSFSSIHNRLLSTINELTPESTIYLLSPNQVEFDPNLINIIQMNGFYNDVPLKEGYLDILVIIGVPSKSLIRKSIIEWKRILSFGGTLAILTPTILVEQFQHPMSIGQFIESYEHESMKRHEFPDKETLSELIRTNFSNINQNKLVHITTFQANKK